MSNNMPSELNDILSSLPIDDELDITVEELDKLKSVKSLELMFDQAEKKVSPYNEEILKRNDFESFINILFKSIEDLKDKIMDIKISIRDDHKKKIETDIIMFNRTTHGLKGQVYAYSAYTIGDMLHAIEDITTNDLSNDNENLKKLPDFLIKKIEVIEELALMIKNDTYETEVNKNKKFIDEQGINNSKNIFEKMRKQLSEYLSENIQARLNPDEIIDNLEMLIRIPKESRYKNFLIERKKELNILINNINLADSSKKNIIDKEKKNLEEYINVSEDMLNLIEENNSDYYNIAISRSKDQNLIKRKVVLDTVNIEVETLNNILVKMGEAKIENTQVENTIKNSESNFKTASNLIDNLDKLIQFYEIYSNSKIQSLNNEVRNGNELFDPLEMDNYTELQEKTRIAKEILLDLKGIFINEDKNIAIKKNANKLMEVALQKTNDTLMSTRLKSVKSYLNEFIKNTVLTASKDLGKEIEIEIIGDHLEVDSVIMDKLKSPLLHTLRNSVSHGIEEKKVRIENGKNPIGKIECIFEQKNGKLTVYVNDDGAGINVKKVESKAREKGIWTEDKQMTEQQAVDVICMPNFSTQDKAHQISGRGVGMDAVKNEVIKLNGRYDIISREGKGLNVAIQIPTSLSNKDVLLVSCSKQKLAIPNDLFVAISIFEPSELMECSKKGKINFNGENVDFRYLSDLMGLNSDNSEKSECNYVLLLSETGEMDDSVKIAVAVEKITNEMVTQVPIKTIGRTLSNVPGIVATTILSNGKAAFIYDPIRAKIALLKHYGFNKINKDVSLPLNDKNKGKQENQSKGLVMVVDDSSTIRKSTVRFLEKNGYNHIVAIDGEDAKAKIVNVIPDLILLDVEMPKMDGFQFAEYIKESEKHKNIPIIMITSRTADKHKSRAAKIGVDDYMSKPFTSEILLPTIKRLIKK